MAAATTEQYEHQFKELDKFMMFTPAPGVENQRSSLTWSTFRGNPRITVFTRVPDDTGKGMLQAPMNPTTFLSLMHLLRDVAKGAPGRSFFVENDTAAKDAEGKPTRERIRLSTTWVGKDKDGFVWLSVRAENRPVIAFKFIMSNYHRVFKGDGTALTQEESSSLEALAYAEGVETTIKTFFADLRPPYDPSKAKTKGQGKGNYPNNNGNRQSKPSFDDDLADVIF